MSFLRSLALSLLLCLLAANSSSAQVAVLTPDAAEASRKFSEALLSELQASGVKVLDADLAAAAFASVKTDAPFNLSAETARQMGSVIGCRYFILVKAAELRRSSLEKNQYWEDYAVIYLVSAKTGALIYWSLQKEERDSPEIARRELLAQVPALADLLHHKIADAQSLERSGLQKPSLKTPDDLGQAAARGSRAPIPYNRIKPEYTRTAYLYGIEGTVDLEADIDENGRITRTEITRWLGYGLDEAATKAVRDMNWRPAESGGKPLAMRVLLRYNFRKIEKD